LSISRHLLPRAVCRHLSLSTNLIEKISSLSGMDSLTILSLGRNLIKKLENLDAVAETLEELWISYNQVASLVGCPMTEGGGAYAAE
jgi:dynein light chain 1